MKKPSQITLHKNELNAYGVDLVSMDKLDENVKAAHRDDHYMLIIQQKGTTKIEIDFSPVTLQGPSCCFVTPGQVHRYLQRKNLQGWFAFIDPSLVTDQYRDVFDTHQHLRQTVNVKKDDILFSVTRILEELLSQLPHALSRSIITSQTHTLLGITASRILQSQSSNQPINGQRYNIAKQFKQLIRQHYRSEKQVQQYAAQLNITPLYLNEIVKDITGFPASFWIQQEIILEAQRMLCYTAQDIKQIAWDLGYEDHAYFSRFFKKNTGITALEFRTKNHDLSNHTH